MCTLTFTPEETSLFNSYAAVKGMSLTEIVRRMLLERIEDEEDAALAAIAHDEWVRDGCKTYPFEQLLEELDLHD